jgi:uncharacterized protein (DUF1501 family)
MKRRDFLSRTIPAAILPGLLGNHSVRAMGLSPDLAALVNAGTETDHVLVLVQLSGGNDGLNTVIPLDRYADYFNARTNIAIPVLKALPLTANDRAGLHPAMTGMQSVYNAGQLCIVQSVGYPNPSFSHFRANDIWMSGSDSDQLVNTGWLGRMLGNEYPDFPNGYPNSVNPDPLAIQIGSITSLALQGPLMSMGMSITNPTEFYNLVGGVLDPAPASPSGKELQFIRLIAQQTQQYATSIKGAAYLVNNQSPYPANNPLAEQLKIVARLVKGGLKTRVYMVSAGGFDTHSLQVTAGNTEAGNHANLLKMVSDAMKAFMDDLKFLGIQDRVLGMTFSEFGRRIRSNSSVGTDHGAAAPLFLFGGKVQGGMLGQNPILPRDASVNDNIPHQYDFRSVYATILQDWFCASPDVLQTVLMKNYQSLPLLQSGTCSSGIGGINLSSEGKWVSNYPNPFSQTTKIVFKTTGGHTLIQVMNTMGIVVRTLADGEYLPGTQTVVFDSEGLPSGVYYARYQSGAVQQVRAMLKVK